MPVDEQRILVLTDLLLGAAFADKRFHGRETDMVRALLREVVQDPDLLTAAEARMRSFKPGEFDLAETAQQFVASPAITKRRLVEFVARIAHADEELDLAEDDYLRTLANAVDLPESEYADLALDYTVEDLKQHVQQIVTSPPPVPEE